eukprot:COSAG04_NODE_213_length_20096_cov_7.878632_3_plen_411_part_00
MAGRRAIELRELQAQAKKQDDEAEEAAVVAQAAKEAVEAKARSQTTGAAAAIAKAASEAEQPELDADDFLKQKVAFKDSKSCVFIAILKWNIAKEKEQVKGDFSIENIDVVTTFIGSHFLNSTNTALFNTGATTAKRDWRKTVKRYVEKHFVAAKKDVDAGKRFRVRHKFSGAMDEYMREFFQQNRDLWPPGATSASQFFFKKHDEESAPGKPSQKNALDTFFTQLTKHVADDEAKKKELFPDGKGGNLWDNYPDVKNESLMEHRFIPISGYAPDGTLRCYVASQFHGRSGALRKLLTKATSGDPPTGAKRKGERAEDGEEQDGEEQVGPDQLGESATKKPRPVAAARSKRSLGERQNSEEEETEKEKENANKEKQKEKGIAPPAKKLRVDKVDKRGMQPLTSFFKVKPK